MSFARSRPDRLAESIRASGCRAEGHRRASTAEYVQSLDIARGSVAELETQFLLGHALGYLEQKVWTTLLDRLGDVDRMLAALVRKLKRLGARVPISPL